MQGLAGRVVAITAERRSSEQADLLRSRGATVIEAPTMHTVDLTTDEELRAATDAVIEQPPGVLVATTGYGMRVWFDAAGAWGRRDELIAALSSSRAIARGAKARSALRQVGIDVSWVAPDESMPQVLDHLRTTIRPEERVAVQLFDPGDHPTTAAVHDLAGDLVEVPVYRWVLPDDLEPVHDLIGSVVADEVDAVTFTSQPAARHLFRIADDAGTDGALREAFAEHTLAVCVGHVCAEALVENGVERHVFPDRARLAPMVRLVEERLGPVGVDH